MKNKKVACLAKEERVSTTSLVRTTEVRVRDSHSHFTAIKRLNS